MSIGRFCLLLATAIFIFAPSTSHGITLGQVDTFSFGGAFGWTNGGSQVGGPPPVGPNDLYFRWQSMGSGGVLKRIDNTSQWSGNYAAAGVTGIEMDLINFTTSVEHMNVNLAVASFYSDGYGSTTAFDLPPDAQWHPAIFSLTAGSMTGDPQAPPFANVLANVKSLTIFDGLGPNFVDSGLVGFGVDNIRAVPEPASISILVSGIIGVVLMFRRLKSRRENGPPVG